MSLSITSITRCNGGTGDHIAVAINQEGVTRNFNGSLTEIDEMFNNLSDLEQLWTLVRLWAKYRRLQGRAVTGVNIA